MHPLGARIWNRDPLMSGRETHLSICLYRLGFQTRSLVRFHRYWHIFLLRASEGQPCFCQSCLPKDPGVSLAFRKSNRRATRLKVDEPRLKDIPHGLCPSSDAQLLVDVLNVVADRARAHRQFLRDFPIAGA